MAPRPAISVVIPVAGTRRDVVALAGLALRPGDEVILADNRPAGARTAPLPAPAGARVVDAAGPASAYFARARGAAAASGEWLVFLDADVQPDPGLLDAYFEPPPGPGTTVLAGAIDPWVQRDSLVSRYAQARRMLSQDLTLAGGRPYAQAGNVAVRRDAYARVGGFAESAVSGGDADLCWRLVAAGGRIEARDGARVRHPNVGSVGALLRQLHRHGTGMRWLEQRHGAAFPPPSARALPGRLRHLARGLRSERDPRFALLDFAAAAARDLGHRRGAR